MFGTGGDHVDPSSQASHDDAKGAGCNPGGFGACALACRALRHHRADRLQVAQPGQRRGWQPHAAPASDDADAVVGSCRRKPSQWRFARRCRSGRMIFRPWCGSSPIRMPGAPGWTAACVGMAWGTCATSGPGAPKPGHSGFRTHGHGSLHIDCGNRTEPLRPAERPLAKDTTRTRRQRWSQSHPERRATQLAGGAPMCRGRIKAEKQPPGPHR